MSTTILSVFGNFAPAFLGFAVAVVASVVPLATDRAKINWRKEFRRQIKLAVIRDTLSFDDLQHMAERWNQDRNAVLQSLRVLLAEALAGEDSESSAKVDVIRALLIQHQAREPYAELPENISLQLTRLSLADVENQAAIGQLAASLSELYSSNQRDAVKQKKLASWGFVVGIVGLLLSIPGLYITFRN